MLKSLLIVFFAIAANQTTQAVVVDFDDLVDGQEFNVGDTFDSRGVSMEVIDYDGTGQIARITSSDFTGGTGLDLGFSNKTGVNFDVPTDTSFISVLYLSASFTAGITVNGQMSSIDVGFNRLDGSTLGGASISATITGTAGEQGVLVLNGPISSFAIGGTELWIDDVTFAVPEPSTAALLFAAGVSLLTTRRRHPR